MGLAIKCLFLGMLTATSYRSVPSQTDDSPFFTSIGDRCHKGGVAVSRDLLCGACKRLHGRCKHPEVVGRLHYGDWLYAKQLGFLQVNDVMGAYTTQRVKGKKVRIPIRNRIDVWVKTLLEEKAFHKIHKGGQVEVWKVESPEK